jgi:hypothetical protein
VSWRRHHHPDQGLLIDADVFDEQERQARELQRQARESHRKAERESDRPSPNSDGWNPVFGDPEPAARQLWEWLFAEPWPEGWRVTWVLHILRARNPRGWAGTAFYDERHIWLSYPLALECGRPVEILLHEFAHVRLPDEGHNRKFVRLLNELRARLGLEPATGSPRDA